MPTIVSAENLASAPSGLAQAMGILDGASLVGEQQVATGKEIRRFCVDYPDALHRSCLNGHLTGSAIVVHHDRERVLLIHHRKLDRWLQPGGHADGEGNLALVALKEAAEETGIVGLKVMATPIDLDIHAIPERVEVPRHLHLDVRFLVLAPEGAVVSPDVVETKGARWVSPSDPVLGDAEMARLARRGVDLAQELE